MKKDIIIASLAVIASAAVVATFALDGAGKFGGVQVHADPVEYSVTFDESNKTTVEAVDNNYAIYTTTPRGAKVGVVMGCLSGTAVRFSFNGVSFFSLYLFDIGGVLASAGAYQFSTITGFAISFSGDGSSMMFRYGNVTINSVESGHEYTGLSIAPSNNPMFVNSNNTVAIAISSLTIMYSC